MRRLSLGYWFSIFSTFIFILYISSCKKTDDLKLNNSPDKRIVEILNLKNGINLTKDQYIYNNGILILHYTYEWNEAKGWEKSARSIYKCWSNNFMSTEYVGSDSNWLPILEERAKFVDGNATEVIHSLFRMDTMLMLPSCKWKCSYEDDRMVLCELQTFQNMEWISYFKSENIYIEDQLQRINSYNLEENDWVLVGFTEITYKNNLIDNISNFTLLQEKWKLNEKYEYLYTGKLLSQCNCYKPCLKGDSLYLDGTSQFQYDEFDKLIYQCCSSAGNMIEKFFAYEDSCGNYKATIGEICSVLNFPRAIPVPAQGQEPANLSIHMY